MVAKQLFAIIVTAKFVKYKNHLYQIHSIQIDKLEVVNVYSPVYEYFSFKSILDNPEEYQFYDLTPMFVTDYEA